MTLVETVSTLLHFDHADLGYPEDDISNMHVTGTLSGGELPWTTLLGLLYIDAVLPCSYGMQLLV